MTKPEQQARQEIDRLLEAAGWRVFDLAAANIHAARGVAIREFPLDSGYGFADYLLYVDGKAAGVIEAKKQGATLSGVEFQSGRYAQGLPAGLPAWRRPLPFLYESTGIETHFTQGLDPEPRARPVFAFHRPELLADWLRFFHESATGTNIAASPAPTFLAQLKSMPPLVEDGLWPARVKAVKNLEASRGSRKDLWVLEPKALAAFLANEPEAITAEDAKLAAFHLSRFIREQERVLEARK